MKTGDVIIMGLFAALLIVSGLIFWPLFLLFPSPALRALVLAPLYAVIAEILLRRVKFEGALVLFSMVIGAVTIVFTPLVLPVSVAAGLASELIGLIWGRLKGYRPWMLHDFSRSLASALFPAFQFPLMLFVIALLGPGLDIVFHPILVVALTLVGVLLGLIGCRLGYAIAKRLKPAERLEPNDDSAHQTGK